MELWARNVQQQVAIGAVVGLRLLHLQHFVTVGQSIFFGFVALIKLYSQKQLKSKTKIDDTLDVFPCHGLGGIVGNVTYRCICGGKWCWSGLIHGNVTQFMFYLLAF